MKGVTTGLQVGRVTVATTSHTGLSVEHWTERIVDKIVFVAKQSNSITHQQAVEYKDNIRQIIGIYLKLAIRSDRTTLYNLFLKQGHQDMAEILRKLSNE